MWLVRGTSWSAGFGLLIVAVLLSTSAESRDRARIVVDDPIGPSVGYNAMTAIPYGLTKLGADWLDAMSNFYADPQTDNRDYFDYYRRPHYGSTRGTGLRKYLARGKRL